MTLEEVSKLIGERKQPVIINNGISRWSILGIALIVLKAMNIITWSWWWVLAPFWFPVVLGVVMIVLLILGITVIAVNLETSSESKGSNSTQEPSTQNTTKEVEKKTRRSSTKKKKLNTTTDDTGNVGKNE